MNLPKELTTVTPLSKSLAMVVFISLPIVGFFLGMRYQEMMNLAKSQQEENNLVIESKPTPTPLAIPTIDPSITANWKTYANKDYGFELRYPTHWKPVEIVDGLLRQALYAFQAPDGKVNFQVSREHYVGSLDEYFSTHRKILSDAEGAQYILSDIREISLDGHRAFEIPNRIGDSYESVLIFVKNDDSIYQIDYTIRSGVDLSGYARIDQEKAKILDQILSTLKFTDQAEVPCLADAKQCTDGSYVVRQPPTCEFAKCP